MASDGLVLSPAYQWIIFRLYEYLLISQSIEYSIKGIQQVSNILQRGSSTT